MLTRPAPLPRPPVQLSKAEREAKLDLRPYMDPSPYVVTELVSLRRVYRLFNEIGVRHLAVVDSREQVVGIITRKGACGGTRGR